MGVCAGRAGVLALCRDPCPAGKSSFWGVLVLGRGQELPGMAASVGLGHLCSILSLGGLEPQALPCPLAMRRAQGPCPHIPSGSLSRVGGGGTLLGSPVPLGMRCPAPHLCAGRALCQGLSHCGYSRNHHHGILTVTRTPSQSSLPGCVCVAALVGSSCL